MGLNKDLPLEQQLQTARADAELTLEQLHFVQEELEVYFLKSQDLEKQLQAITATSQQLEALSKDRDALVAECERQKSVAAKDVKKAKEVRKERDELRKRLEAISKDRDALAAEYEKQKSVAQKALKEAQAADNKRELVQKTHDQVVLECEKISSQVKQKSNLLDTAQRMLDGQARYLEDLSIKEELAEQAMDELRLLKREIFHYIQHSRPAKGLKPEQVSRLIELVKKPVTS